MNITVHGKDLSENLCVALGAANIWLDGDYLSCLVNNYNDRDDVISLLNAYGFVVESSYQQGVGWKVVTTGIEEV